MKIEFEQIDSQNIKVIGIRDGVKKHIGDIFTPSGSANNCMDAIQICGIVEAFDYWGCARFQIPIDFNDPKKRIVDSMKGNEDRIIQTKDIQLQFSFHSEKTSRSVDFDNCLACFNKPCTCENKGNHKHISPYNVKREDDLKLEYEKGRFIERRNQED